MTEPLFTVPIEKATELPDLPHEFNGVHNRCWMCGRAALDALHAAWEKASLAETTTHPPLPRERGA